MEQGGTQRHPQDLSTLSAIIATFPSRSVWRGDSFQESGSLHPLPGGGRERLFSPSPQLRPSPPPRVSGLRDHGRRMADVRVSAASLTETVKGQEQCLGRPPAPPKPSPGGPGLLTGPLLMAMAKPPTSWGVGRSCAVHCPTRGLLPPPEGSSLPVATPDFLGCAPSPKTARFQIDPSPCMQLGKLRLKEKGLAQDPSNS